MNEHDDSLDKSSGAYSLGALDAAETAAFEARLAQNEELRAEVAGFTDTAALLGGAVAPVQPPARLRADLLAAIASTPQLPADADFASDAESHSEAPATLSVLTAVPQAEAGATNAAGAEGSNVTDFAAAASRRAGGKRVPARLSYFVAAAAAVAAIFVGGTVVGANLDNSNTTPQASIEQIAVLSTAPDMTRTVISLPEGGTAALMASTEKGLSAVVLTGATALPDDEVYQAWLIRDGVPHDAGVVAGSGDSLRLLDGAFHEGDTVALTVEPAGGSKTPTSDPIFFAA